MVSGPDKDTVECSRPESNRTSTLSRRRLLSATAASSTAALAGCTALFGGSDSQDGDGEYSGETLRVSVWSGNYADGFEEYVVPKFEEETGVNIEINRGWNEILAKIRSAPEDNPPYDVTVTEGQLYYLGRQNDLFLPIRTENVPNYEEVMDFYQNIRSTEYGMPVDGAPCTLIHRDDQEFDLESWSDFTSDAVKNSEGVGIDAGFWVFPMHSAAVGMDQEALAGEIYDETQHEDVVETLEEWPITGWASSGEDIWQQFQNGVIDSAQWYFEQAEFDIDDYDNLSHTAPEQNTGYLDHYCVVRGTDKRDLGEHFINFLMDAEVQSEWSEHVATLFCNENVEYADDLGEELPRNSEEASNIAFPDWEYISEYNDEFSNTFTELQTDSE